MRTFELVCPCHFGLEAVLKKEIQDLGYEVSRTVDGKVSFMGDAEAVCRANIFLRTAERVLLAVGRFHAESFEELFQGVRALPWEDFLPRDARFWVKKATSVRSRLFSASDIQSVAKKAMVERMRSAYGAGPLLEDGAEYPVRVFLMGDEALVALDTTGDSLHKRGYRARAGQAPLSETLAAALLGLTPWRAGRILVDPFCGSGTIPIEAAMMAANIAPGAGRHFTAEGWEGLIPRGEWASCAEEAREMADPSAEADIQGYDSDGEVLRLARENARRAGVEGMIHFQQRPVSELSHPKKYGFIVTNPPYGERMEGEGLPELYAQLGEAYRRLDSWSMYVLSGYEGAERCIGRPADRNRKVYNGMIQAYFYQYLGPRPPRRGRQ